MALYNEQREGQAPVVQTAGDNTVVNWQQQPGGFQRSSQILSTIMATLEEEEKKKQKKIQEKADSYKVLREAGYDSKAAYEAMRKGEFPSEQPGSTAEEQKASAGLEKTQAETEKIRTETENLKGPVPEGFIRVGNQIVRKNSVGTVDVKDLESVVEGIAQGRLSPKLTDYSRRDRTAVGAMAQRRGLNLNKMYAEYSAVNKYITSANSATQLRLRQAIGSVQESLGNLRSLNEQFKRSGWTPANAAELKLALTGTNPAKRDIATRFITQLTTMKDELGQAFMGGNSPTDRAIQLAQDILNSNYGFSQLNAALDELDKNLTYRMNAINSGAPIVPGGEMLNQDFLPRYGPQNTSRLPQYGSEKEALESGASGRVMINGRLAIIEGE